MSEKEQKVLNEFLSKTLKIDAEQLATLYNEAGELQGLQIAFDADASRISRQKAENTNQYNRGLKEGASKIEKELKAKYEMDSELIGVELVDTIVLSKVEEATKGATKDISKHPEMLKARQEWEKEKKKSDDEWQKKLDGKDQEFARIRLNEKISKRGLTLLEEFRPVLPADANKASQWRQTYVNDLLSYNYQDQDNDDPVILDKEGNPMKDAHGYMRKFKEFARDTADKYFDYVKADERSSAGNKDSGGTQSPNMPKTVEEYEKELKSPDITPKRRVELVNYWSNKDKK